MYSLHSIKTLETRRIKRFPAKIFTNVGMVQWVIKNWVRAPTHHTGNKSPDTRRAALCIDWWLQGSRFKVCVCVCAYMGACVCVMIAVSWALCHWYRYHPEDGRLQGYKVTMCVCACVCVCIRAYMHVWIYPVILWHFHFWLFSPLANVHYFGLFTVTIPAGQTQIFPASAQSSRWWDWRQQAIPSQTENPFCFYQFGSNCWWRWHCSDYHYDDGGLVEFSPTRYTVREMVWWHWLWLLTVLLTATTQWKCAHKTALQQVRCLHKLFWDYVNVYVLAVYGSHALILSFNSVVEYVIGDWLLRLCRYYWLVGDKVGISITTVCIVFSHILSSISS